jgi:thiol-disulfide isomerase/thioredoxin
MAGDPKLARVSPRVEVPNQFERPAQTKPEQPSLPAGPAQVPSCVLTGEVLYNFALNDLSGRPWEYRRDRRGRLVLLDFWSTDCLPCRYAIPHLKIWQNRYGPYGLEVIGIAYEKGTPEQQAAKANLVGTNMDIRYRLLLGADAAPTTCPVRAQFRVASFPTVVLLDETGRIIYRSEGLGAEQIKDVDLIIRQRLGVR